MKSCYRLLVSLFNKKERAAATLDSIGDAVISTDVSGRVTNVNDASVYWS